jgi:serine/threonine protein kinase
MFRREKAIFEALSLQNHKHLTSLLASYRMNGYYHMILPRAMGDLLRFWLNFRLPDFDEKTVLWSAEQISGLLDALKTVHTFELKQDLIIPSGYRVQDNGGCMVVKAGEERYGRHGDLKPENILYFEHDRKLRIADFGLGRFHGRDSRSGIDARKVQGTLTYEPPECSLATSVSRKYDIWSMGCIVLEFVTWLLLGYKGVEEFANSRGEPVKIFIGGRVEIINDDTFFTVLKDLNDKDSEKYAVVRQGVSDWVALLHSSDKCSLLMHDLLDPAPRPLPTPEHTPSPQRNAAIGKSVHWDDKMPQLEDMKLSN